MPRTSKSWTYGAEHELADWDSSIPLPSGFARSPDYTIVNSNGIAAQPNPRVYQFGGEINTPPTESPEGQVLCLRNILGTYPNAQVNYRSNLHIHVRIPGLVSSLPLLKKLQRYIHEELPKVISLLEPIPHGNTPAEKKRERRRRVSHHTFLTRPRLQYQLTACSPAEFFEREVPRSKAGKVMWHAQPRLAVGLRQMLQTDTIEFRHFPGTLDEQELLVCVEWCRDFLQFALNGKPIEDLWDKYRRIAFPQFPGFEFATEVGYQATACHNGLKQEAIKQNIQLILGGKFHGSKAEARAAERACGLSR